MMLPVFTLHGKQFIYATDLIPTQSNLSPKMVSGYDNNPALLYHEKVSFFDEYERSDCHIIFFHEPDIQKREVKLTRDLLDR